MTLIDRFIPGIPKAQPRPRAYAMRFGQTYSARMYDAGTSDPWKDCIIKDLLKARLKPAAPWDGALRLDLTFYLPRPASRNRKKDPDGEIPHLGKPDVDNLFKAVADCLTRASFIADDSMIVSSRTEKFYHAKICSPGVLLVLARWEPEPKPARVYMEVGQ